MPINLEPRLLATIGEVEVFQVPEIAIPTSPRWLLPGASDEDLNQAKAALDPVFFGDDGRLIQSVHAYVLKSPGHVTVIDAGVGNHKRRGGDIPVFDMLDTPFLARLESIGVTPEAVDLVLSTHMHVDHLGWDTRLAGERWVPTFPRARHLFVRAEYEAFVASTEHDAGARAIWDDTVAPLDAAGLVDLVAPDVQINEAMRLEGSHGHTPGHANVVLESRGLAAVFIGDVMHNPIQVLLPGVASALNGPQAATDARLDVLRRYADTGTLVFGAHFSPPCGGHVRSTTNGFTFEPLASSSVAAAS